MVVRRVGDLREVLSSLPDDAPIDFEYDGPLECCDGHVHDITLISECDAEVEAWGSSPTIRLSGGHP